MAWVKTIVSELLALFVDDAGFALAIIAWLAVAWLVLLPRVPPLSPAILFLGLALILIESVLRRGRSP